MKRFDCLQALASRLRDELVVANLANTSTELRKVRDSDANLYFVGMGMVTPYALGLALALPQRPVLALDGDGGILFDLSVFGVLAQNPAANLCVVIFDNEGYVSTGKSRSVASLTAGGLDIEAVARASGVTQACTVRTVDEFVAAVDAGLSDASRPHVVVAKIDATQAFVGTSLIDARENKYRFVRHVEGMEGRTILKPSAREHGEPPRPDPVFTPVAPDAAFGDVLHEALRENGVDFVVGLPCSGFSAAQQKCIDDPDMRYVPVAHEGTGIGLCAGAWLGGKRSAALIENFGVYAAAYHLLRGNYNFGIPTLLVAEYRGDAGETEFFGDCGDMTEPMLAAMRINHRVIRSLADLKPAIRDGLRWMNFGLRPYAVVPSFDLTRPKPARG